MSTMGNPYFHTHIHIKYAPVIRQRTGPALHCNTQLIVSLSWHCRPTWKQKHHLRVKFK